MRPGHVANTYAITLGVKQSTPAAAAGGGGGGLEIDVLEVQLLQVKGKGWVGCREGGRGD